MERPRLLLVEPDAVARLRLLAGLHARWRVHVATSADEAVRALRTHVPAVAAVAVCGHPEGLRGRLHGALRGGRGDARAGVACAVRLRTDRQPPAALVLYAHAPDAEVSVWPEGVRAPEAWVPDGRDPETLHAALARVTAHVG